MEAHLLQAWRDESVVGGIEGLKGKPLALEGLRLREAERKIGELMTETEVLRAVV